MTRTLTFLSLLALAGCGSPRTRGTTCRAYDYGRAAACTACSALPNECPWAAGGEVGQ